MRRKRKDATEGTERTRPKVRRGPLRPGVFGQPYFLPFDDFAALFETAIAVAVLVLPSTV